MKYRTHLQTVFIRVCLCVFGHTHTSKHHTTHQCLSDILSSCLHVQNHCPCSSPNAVVYIFLSSHFEPLSKHVVVFASFWVFFSMHIRSCFIIIMQCFRARVDEALNHPLHASVFDAPYRSAMVTLPLVTVLKKKSGGDWCRVAREWQCYISVYLSTRLSPSFAAVLTSHPI